MANGIHTKNALCQEVMATSRLGQMVVAVVFAAVFVGAAGGDAGYSAEARQEGLWGDERVHCSGDRTDVAELKMQVRELQAMVDILSPGHRAAQGAASAVRAGAGSDDVLLEEEEARFVLPSIHRKKSVTKRLAGLWKHRQALSKGSKNKYIASRQGRTAVMGLDGMRQFLKSRGSRMDARLRPLVMELVQHGVESYNAYYGANLLVSGNTTVPREFDFRVILREGREGSRAEINRIQLSGPWVKSLPAALAKCVQLSTIVVQHSGVSDFGLLEGLTQLVRVDLSYNKKMTTLPDLRGSPGLRRLVASHCSLTGEGGTAWLNKSGIRLLTLNDNNLDRIPPLPRAESLKKLLLGDNSITLQPGSVMDLSRYHRMSLVGFSGNPLRHFHLVGGPALSLLMVDRCELESFNLTLTAPSDRPRLRKLHVSHNRLESLDLDRPQYRALEVIMAQQNLLREAPAGLSGLKKLRLLQLAHNRIATLDWRLGMIRGAKFICLDDNRIERMSTDIRHAFLVKNDFITLAGNPIERVAPRLRSELTAGRGLVKAPGGGVGSILLDLLDNEQTFRGYVPFLRDLSKIYRITQVSDFTLAAGAPKGFPRVFNPCANAGTVYFKCSGKAVPVGFQFKLVETRPGMTKTLPESIKELKSLRHIKITGGLATLPDGIGSLHRLSVLTLNDNQLRTMPASLFKLKRLVVVRLAGNQLASLPEIEGDLAGDGSLETFDLSRNQLSSLSPTFFSQNKRLRYLNLSHNQLVVNESTAWVDMLLKLEYLVDLDISFNALTWFGTELHPESDLKYLRASNNKFMTLPTWVYGVQWGSLDFSHNLLTEIHQPFDDISKAKALLMSHNRISSVPPWLSIAGENYLIGGEQVMLPTYVEQVDFSHNRLTEVPQILHGHVGTYELSHNNIRALRHRNMTIEHCHLENNKVDFISDSFFVGVVDSAYPTRAVHLKHNLLKTVPHSLMGSGIAILDLSDNIVELLPPGSLRQFFSQTYSKIAEKGRELHLDGNRLYGTFVNRTDELPALMEWDTFRVDLNALGDHAKSAIEVMLGQDDIKGLESAPRVVSAEYDCSIVKFESEKRVLVRSCECRDGFYQSFTWPYECLICVANAQCKAGEIRCHRDYFLDMEEPTCVSCDYLGDGAKCVDNQVIPEPGYWRPSVSSKHVFKCANADVCLGGVNATENCAQRHTGRQCGACEVGTYKDGAGRCRDCPKILASVLYIMVTLFGGAAVVGFLALSGDSMSGRSARGAGGDLLLDGSMALTPSADASEVSSIAAALVKMAIGFVQLLAMFPSIYEVEWHNWLDAFPDLFGWLNMDLFTPSSLECVWERFSRADNATLEGFVHIQYSFYESMCLMGLVPLATPVLVWAAWGAFTLGRRVLKPKAGVSQRYVDEVSARCLLVTLLIAYLPISTRAFQFFVCVSFNEGKTYYLKADLSQECWDARWYSFLPVAVALVVVLAVGFPVVLMWLLLPLRLSEDQARYCGQSPWVRRLARMVAKLFVVYRSGYEYWDATEMIRKLLVTAVAVHFGSSGEFQCAVSLAVCFLAVVLHMHAMPFRTTFLNHMQTALLMMTYLTLVIGLLKTLHVPEHVSGVYTALIVGMDVLLVIIMMCVGLAVAMKRGALLVKKIRSSPAGSAGPVMFHK